MRHEGGHRVMEPRAWPPLPLTGCVVTAPEDFHLAFICVTLCGSKAPLLGSLLVAPWDPSLPFSPAICSALPLRPRGTRCLLEALRSPTSSCSPLLSLHSAFSPAPPSPAHTLSPLLCLLSCMEIPSGGRGLGLDRGRGTEQEGAQEQEGAAE